MFNIFEKEQYKEYCVRKLVKNWIDHKKIIILLDFDNTILPYNDVERNLCNKVFESVLEAQKLGTHLILYTCRDGRDLDNAIDYCGKRGLYFDDVNPQTPSFEGLSIKPLCNIMLDDRAGLMASLEVLNDAIKLYKEYLQRD